MIGYVRLRQEQDQLRSRRLRPPSWWHQAQLIFLGIIAFLRGAYGKFSFTHIKSNFFAIAAVTDPALSSLTGVTSGTSHTYTFRGVDINGAAQTFGGEGVYLDVSPIGTVAGLPQSIQMTDHNNGQYTASFIASPDTFSVASRISTLGLWETGLYGNRWVSNIWYDFGEPPSFIGTWSGTIVAPTSELYTFVVQHDDTYEVTINGIYHVGTCCGYSSFSQYLTAGVEYSFDASIWNAGGPCFILMWWQTPTIAQETIPASAFFQPSRTVEPISDSTTTTYTFNSLHIEDQAYPVTLQARDNAGNINSVSTDVITVKLTRSDGVGSEVYSTTATHTSYGSYQATLTPAASGVYDFSAIINGVSMALHEVIVYCDFVAWTPPHQFITVEMGYTENVAFSPTLTNGLAVPSDSCPLTITTSDGSDLLSFTVFDMTVTTVDPLLVGNPRISQVRNVSMTRPSYSGSLDFTVTVDVIPSCTLSALQQVSPPVDMSTPIFGNIFQDLVPLFTHAYVDFWPVDTCVIAFEIKTTGDTSYLTCNSVTTDPLRTTELHLYPYIFSDEGTYPTEVIASYLDYSDQVPPPDTLTSSTFIVTVEPECRITAYANDPIVSTTLDTHYSIGDPTQSFVFDIRFEPTYCNYFETYTFTIDGVAASPSWLSIDRASEPHQIQIQTSNAGDTGIYSVGIQSATNTTPKYVSSDQYIFKVTISFDSCSSLVYDAQNFPDLNFEIADGALPSSYTFTTHTDTGGFFNCGTRQYKLVQEQTGFVFEGRNNLAWNEPLLPYNLGDQLTFSFETVDPYAVGVHEIIVQVESVDFPEWNEVIYYLEYFDLVVTASCWNTVMQYDASYTPLGYHQQIVGAATSTIDVAPVEDTVSLASTPFDGITYCGSRTFTYISVTSDDYALIDDSWLIFNADDTFSVQSSLDSQWGLYTVTYGVELDIYPDFVMQELTFDVEIVPDCLNSVFSMIQPITFDPIYRNLVDSLDVTGHITFHLEGAYNSFCGGLEYEFDPSGPSQTYLNHDGLITLTLEPDETHPTGVHSHILRARLTNFPAAFHDEPFTVEIVACDINAFYADSVDTVIVSPARQDKVIGQTGFVIGRDSPMTFDFSFTDFDVVQSTGCEAAYTMQYLLFVSGTDVTLSPPSWVSVFDPTLPSVTVDFFDITALGAYTLTVKGELQTNPLARISTTQIDFTFDVLVNPCLLELELLPPVIPDLDFTIQNDPVSTVHVFDEMTTTVGACGPVDYVLAGDAPGSTLTLDSSSRTLELSSISGHDVGEYASQVVATLRNYPTQTTTIDFQVTILSVCTDTVLFFKTVGDGVYFESTVPYELDLSIKDRKGQEDGGDGLSLCGPRIYEIVKKDVTCVNNEIRSGKNRLTGRQVPDNFPCIDTAPDEIVHAEDGAVFLQYPVPLANGVIPSVQNNVEVKWRVKVSLEEYEDVKYIELVFSTYKMKACNRQQLFSKYVNKNNPRLLDNLIGEPPKVTSLDLITIENEYSFEYFGRSDLAAENHCGLIGFDVFNYDYLKEVDPMFWDWKQQLPNDSLIDRESPIPSFLDIEVDPIQETLEATFSSNNEEDAGQHYFLLFVYLIDYPEAEETEKFYVQIQAIIRVTFISKTSELFLNNEPPVWMPEMMIPDCAERVVRVQQNQPTEQYSGGGHAFAIDYYAKDPDYDDSKLGSFFLSFGKAPTGNDIVSSQCPACLLTNYSLSPLEYESNEPYVSRVRIAGIPEWTFQQLGYTVTYSDGLSSISKTQYITFIPENSLFESDTAQSGDCMTYEQVLQKYNLVEEVEEVVEEIIEEEILTDIEVVIEQKIEVEEEVVQETVDLTEFFQQLSLLQSQKANFEENSPLYSWAMKELRKLPFPMPLVIKVTYTGRAHIHFSKPLAIPALQELPAYVALMIEEKWLDLSLQETDEFDRLDGIGYFDPTYWNETITPGDETLVNNSSTTTALEPETSSRRRLQSFIPEKDGELYYIKDFTWTIARLTNRRMELQLNFDVPQHISPDIQDRLLVSFVEQEKLLQMSKDDLAIMDLDFFNQTRTVPRQLEEELVVAIEETSTQISGFLQATSLVNIGASAIQGQSLQKLWSSLSSLQLTVHVPLNNIAFPTVVEILFSELIKIVTFDVLESLDEVGYGLEYDVSPTVAFNDGFDTLGYDSSEPIGLLGTINFLLAIVVLQIIWYFTPRVLCFKRFSRMKGKDLTSGLIRFWLQMTLETLICSGAVFWPREVPTLIDIEEKNDFDKFLIAYSALIGFLTFAFIALTVYVTCRYPRQSVELSKKIRKLESQPLLKAVEETAEEDASNSQKQLMIEQITTPLTKKQKKSMAKMTAQFEDERQKFKYFEEYFVGLIPHSQLVQFHQVIYLWRRVFIVFIAFQMGNVPVLQIGCFTFLCHFNLVFLLHAQIYTDRWTYQLEVINDFVVYCAGIHGLAFTATVSLNMDAFDKVGYSLVCIVLFNLLFNVLVLIFQSCLRLRKRLAAKYARAQQGSHAWDYGVHDTFKCKCACVTCGAIETRATKKAGKIKIIRNPVDRSVFSQTSFELVLVPCSELTQDLITGEAVTQDHQVLPVANLKFQLLQDRKFRRQEAGTIETLEASDKQLDEGGVFDRPYKAELIEERKQRRERIQVEQQNDEGILEKDGSSLMHSSYDDNSKMGRSIFNLLDVSVEQSKSDVSAGDGAETSSSSSDTTPRDDEEIEEGVSLKQARYRSWAKRSDDIDMMSLSHVIKRLRVIEDGDAQRGDAWADDSSNSSDSEVRPYESDVRASYLALFADKNDIELNIIDEVMEDDDDSVVAMIKSLPVKDLDILFDEPVN